MMDKQTAESIHRDVELAEFIREVVLLLQHLGEDVEALETRVGLLELDRRPTNG